MQAEIDNEEGGDIHIWNVHACGFHIASKLRRTGPIGKALVSQTRRELPIVEFF